MAEYKDLQDKTTQEIPVEKLSDSAFYRMYFKEVLAKTVVSEAEQSRLYHKLLSGDGQAMNAIVDNWLMRILEIAKFYKDEPVLIEDVIQEGNLGLWTALSNLPDDLTVDGVDTYLLEKVKESMENYIREMTGEMDREQSVVGKAALLYSAREHLAKESGEVPSNRQLSDFTHIPVEEIEDILALMKEQDS